jgi:hypothetical protein
LGESICLSAGNNYCSGKSVSNAICDETKNCKDFDSLSLVQSVISQCGTPVLHFGFDRE